MRLIFGSKILLSLIAGGCLCVLNQSPSFVPMPVVLALQAFSSLESNLDSNGRDLLAISYALKSFYKWVIKRKLVRSFTRSRNAAVISNNDLHLGFVYADSLSRIIDFNDWNVSTACFEFVSSLFGPFYRL